MKLFMNLALTFITSLSVVFVFTSNFNALAYEDWATQIINAFDSDDNNQSNKNTHETTSNTKPRHRIKVKNEVGPLMWL